MARLGLLLSVLVIAALSAAASAALEACSDVPNPEASACARARAHERGEEAQVKATARLQSEEALSAIKVAEHRIQKNVGGSPIVALSNNDGSTAVIDGVFNMAAIPQPTEADGAEIGSYGPFMIAPVVDLHSLINPATQSIGNAGSFKWWGAGWHGYNGKVLCSNPSSFEVLTFTQPTRAIDFLFQFFVYNPTQPRPTTVTINLTTKLGSSLSYVTVLTHNVIDATYFGFYLSDRSDSFDVISITADNVNDDYKWFGIGRVRVPARESSGLGDPHLKTFDGAYMTTGREGDFLLLESKFSGLQLHARFCKNTRGNWAAWTCAVALRCAKGADAVEISPRDMGTGQPKSASAPTIANAGSEVTLSCDAQSVTVHLQRVRFHRMSYFNFIVTTADQSGDLRGLLGSPNGIKDDDFVSRNGQTIKLKEDKEHFIGDELTKEVVRIQDEWRVQEDEKLFSAPFVPAGTEPLSYKRDVLSVETAREACSLAGLKDKHLEMCIHDVKMTGSVHDVKNYASFTKFLADKVPHAA